MTKPKTLQEVKEQRKLMRDLFEKYEHTPEIQLWKSMHRKQQQMMTYVVELRDSILIELEKKNR
jgi:hypothetical protein